MVSTIDILSGASRHLLATRKCIQNETHRSTVGASPSMGHFEYVYTFKAPRADA